MVSNPSSSSHICICLPNFCCPETEILLALYDSILILNDAAPRVSDRARAADFAFVGEIHVSLESPVSIGLKCGAGAVACAMNNINRIWGYTTSATLYIPDDFDVSEYMFPRKVIVHELLHALGIVGHVDSIEFPDSIMGASGEYIPNLGHIISKIDREVLQIMYMSQTKRSLQRLGRMVGHQLPCDGAVRRRHLEIWRCLVQRTTAALGQGRHAGYGPGRQQAVRHATWNGSLLGFSGPSPIANAELEVRLATLAG